METHPFYFFFTSTLLLVLISSPTSQPHSEATSTISTDPGYYYNLCGTSTCGNTPLGYPFGLQSFCGHPDLKTTCVNNDHIVLWSNRVPQAEPTRVIGNLSLDAVGATVYVAYESLFGCGHVSRKNFVTDAGLFTLSKEYKVSYFLNCTQRPNWAPPGSLQPSSCLECKGSRIRRNNLCFYSTNFNDYAECEKFMVHTREEVNVSAIKDMRGFIRSRGGKIRYTKPMSCRNCESSGGRCGSSSRTGDFVCFCPSSVHRLNCSDGMIEDRRTWLPRDREHKISAGVIAAVSVSSLVVLFAIVTTVLLVLHVIRRNARIKIDDERGGGDKHFTITLVDGISPTRYTYSQIKKFTSNFSVKLGEGGFGVVYKGFIQGTGAVAVKLLKRSEQNQNQFMNEVATVGRIHHHNLVGLFGYCAQDTTRALVYEFIEMGSLDKYHVHEDQNGSDEQIAKEDAFSLTCRQMFNIAVDTARGILYLHEGCRNRILHLDIKPHNVLIDSNLSAKVADFGLARMIDEDHSHVSITRAQGTPGYAPPEMWTKAYGPLTDKSDVYSYGMLLLEMAVRRKENSDDSSDASTNRIYFPEWVLKKAQKGELKADTSTAVLKTEEKGGRKEEEEEEEVLEKMCMVGLWCIQHIPSNRPTMRKVIQMLEGINNEIQIPPYPFPDKFNEEVFLSLYFRRSSQPNPHLLTSAI